MAITNKNKIRILHIDEDIEFIESTKFLLGDNFMVESPDAVFNALESISTFKPDVILLDIEFPNSVHNHQHKQKLNLLNILRGESKYKTLPVIIIGHCLKKEVETWYQSLEADGYISKPVQIKQLIEKINEIIKERSQDV